MDHRMTALRVTGVACLLLFALLRGVPAHAQAYVPGVTCPSGQAMTGYTPQSGIVCAAVGSAVFDNKLINPTMEIDQAHEGSSVSLVSGTPSYVVDGVKIGFVSSGNTTNATVSCQRASDAPTGFTYSLKCTVGTAASGVGNGDYLVALIPIEADNIQDALLGTASAQTLCLQWQSKISIGGYVAGWALQNFAQTRSYPSTVAAASASTWTANQACFTGDTGGIWVTSGSNGGAYLVLTFAAGSTYQGTAANWSAGDYLTTSSQSNSLLTTASGSFEITNVKLEIAAAASPFRRRPIAQELELCQRYYQKTYDLGTALATATHNGMVGGFANYESSAWTGVAVTFPVAMRAVPTTVSLWDGAGTANKGSQYTGAWTDGLTAVTIAQTSTKGLVWIQSVNTAIMQHYAADSRL
jgi:hypothetical protein